MDLYDEALGRGVAAVDAVQQLEVRLLDCPIRADGAWATPHPGHTARIATAPRCAGPVWGPKETGANIVLFIISPR